MKIIFSKTHTSFLLDEPGLVNVSSSGTADTVGVGLVRLTLTLRGTSLPILLAPSVNLLAPAFDSPVALVFPLLSDWVKGSTDDLAVHGASLLNPRCFFRFRGYFLLLAGLDVTVE